MAATADGQTWRRLSAAELTAAVERHQRFVRGIPGGMRANLAFCDLSGMAAGGYDLSNAEMTGARLGSVAGAGMRLRGATLYGADLRRANLTRADLSRADLREGALATTGRLGELTTVAHDQTPSDLGTASLRHADLSRARIAHGLIGSADLSDTVLRGAKLMGSDFRNANLTGADLEGADLSEVNLSGAILHGAVLRDAVWTGANLEGADLMGAVLDARASKAARAAGGQNLPRGRDTLAQPIAELLAAHAVWVATKGADGRRIELTGVDLSDLDLSGQVLSGAVLRGCVLTKLKAHRMLAPALQQALSLMVEVKDVLGNDGNNAAAYVAKAGADGHVLLLTTTGMVTFNQFIHKNLAFDPQRDFAAVSLVAEVDNVLMVRPDFPAKTLAELTALAKSAPGRVRYARVDVASTNTLATFLLANLAGVEFTMNMTWTSAVPSMQAAAEGAVDLTMQNIPAALPAHGRRRYLRDGRCVRARATPPRALCPVSLYRQGDQGGRALA